MLDEEILIKGCKNQNSSAQKALYQRYAPLMRTICLRYSHDYEEAKDMLQEGFIKVFDHIHQFENKGSLEGWVKRIIINTAISYYKKNKKTNQHQRIDDEKYDAADNDSDAVKTSEIDADTNAYDVVVSAEFTNEDLMEALHILPATSRLIFNMFFIDDLKHKEIGAVLNIDENTSRIRLMRARVQVQKYLYDLSMKKLAIQKI